MPGSRSACGNSTPMAPGSWRMGHRCRPIPTGANDLAAFSDTEGMCQAESTLPWNCMYVSTPAKWHTTLGLGTPSRPGLGDVWIFHLAGISWTLPACSPASTSKRSEPILSMWKERATWLIPCRWKQSGMMPIQSPSWMAPRRKQLKLTDAFLFGVSPGLLGCWDDFELAHNFAPFTEVVTWAMAIRSVLSSPCRSFLEQGAWSLEDWAWASKRSPSHDLWFDWAFRYG